MEHSLRYQNIARWTLCLVLITLADKAFSQKKITYNDKFFVYTLAFDSSLSPDSVNSMCTVKSISIQGRKDHKTIQTIFPQESSPSCSFPEDEIFVIEDVNFDGYNDIRLLQFVPAAPNLPYYFWVYNPKVKHFQRQKDLDEITSPQFDKKKRLIYSFWRSNGYHHGTSTYKYINGTPILVEVAEEKEEDGKNITIVKRRVNGKLKLVIRTVEKIE